jgi:hypothetical protein
MENEEQVGRLKRGLHLKQGYYGNTMEMLVQQTTDEVEEGLSSFCYYYTDCGCLSDG